MSRVHFVLKLVLISSNLIFVSELLDNEGKVSNTCCRAVLEEMLTPMHTYI